MDISSLRYASLIQAEELNRTRSTEAVSKASELTQSEAAKDNAAENTQAAFAQTLKEEIEQLRESSEASDQEVLSGSALNLNSLSEMMGSTNGRQAISAMAEASLNSVVFGTTDDDGNSLFSSIFQTDYSVEAEFADVLQNILNQLETGENKE